VTWYLNIALALFRFDLEGLVWYFPNLGLNDYVGASGDYACAVSVTYLMQSARDA
jgi:hypothetical protein